MASTANPGFGQGTGDSRTGSSNRFFTSSLNRSTCPSLQHRDRPTGGRCRPRTPVQRPFPFGFAAFLLQRVDRFALRGELREMRRVRARVRDDVDVAFRGIRRVRRVVDRDRFWRVQLTLARARDAGLTSAFADLEFLRAVLHAPSPRRDEFARRPKSLDTVVAAVDDVDVAAGFDATPRPVRRAARHCRSPVRRTPSKDMAALAGRPAADAPTIDSTTSSRQSRAATHARAPVASHAMRSHPALYVQLIGASILTRISWTGPAARGPQSDATLSGRRRRRDACGPDGRDPSRIHHRAHI